MTEPSDRAGTYQLMDAMRALAAGMVAFSHIRSLFILDRGEAGASERSLYSDIFYALSGFGHGAVILFFVLSGFWITKSVVRSSHRQDFWPSYLIDRLSRLWIVLIPALLLGLALDMIGVYWLEAEVYSGSIGNSINENVASTFNLSTFVGNMVFLQTIAVPPLGSNGPLWSVAYEFWFYLWFPAIWIAVRYRKASLALLTCLVGAFQPEILLGAVSWLCGSALYAAVERVDRTRVPAYLRWSAFAFGSTIFAIGLAIARGRASLWFDPLIALSFAAFLFGVYLVGVRPLRLAAPLARYGASSSFSLYAIHFPIVALAAAILARGSRFPADPGSIAIVIGVLIAVIAIAWLFSKFTEAQTGRLRKHMRMLIVKPQPAVASDVTLR